MADVTPNTPSFALSISGMLLIAGCHIGFAYAIYEGLRTMLPVWAALPLTLLCYWILRNLIVVHYRKRIRGHFWLVGEGHRATGRTVSGPTKRVLDLFIAIYGNPLGAYDGELDFLDSMEMMARPEFSHALAQGVPPPPISLGELYGLANFQAARLCPQKKI